jgi:soluble lytic murein transglycosylase-like protein
MRPKRPPRVAAAVCWGGVAMMTLIPAPVGGGPLDPSAMIQSADRALAAGAAIASDVNAVIDPLPTVVSALADCANRLSSQQRWHLARIIKDESEEHGYDPLFVTALMQVESECSATARGPGIGGDALGLVQLLPSTAREVARRIGVPWRGERTLTEPASNIQIALHYLGELEEQLGDPYRAVAAYNLGPARVLHMSRDRALRTSYVRKVLSRYERLLDQYA